MRKREGYLLAPKAVWLLCVGVITNEDDCSVQLARRAEKDPSTRNCSAPDTQAGPDCYNLDYRWRHSAKPSSSRV